MIVILIVWIVFIRLNKKKILNLVKVCPKKKRKRFLRCGNAFWMHWNISLINIKFMKIQSIIHADLESMIKRTDGFTNNPEKPSQK